MVCRGRPLSDAERAEVLAVPLESGTRVVELPRSAGPCWVMGGWVGDRRVAKLLVGRTDWTAGFYAAPWSDDSSSR